jgi:hypothetical protein
MSDKKHILVEGKTDKEAFEKLLKALFKRVPQNVSPDDVRIEMAENLIRGDTDMKPSNRERIEYICTKILNTPDAKKLIGFVDRELDGFELGDTPCDLLNGHRILGRVVWSRGHSIENYCFDAYILCQALRQQSRYYDEVTEYYSRALTLFGGLLEPTIRLACAYSLVAVEDREIDALKKMIDWKLLDISSSDITFNLALLRQYLAVRPAFAAKAENLVERFLFWYERVNRADFSCAKWLCHGHIGIRFIRSVFERCVVEACKQENLQEEKIGIVLRKTILHAREDDLFPTCSSFWIYEALLNHYDCPREVFTLLDLSVS